MEIPTDRPPLMPPPPPVGPPPPPGCPPQPPVIPQQPPLVPPQSPAQPQCRINMTALTWGEICGSAGNVLQLIFALPIVAFCKLFRVPLMGDDRFPLQIGLQDVDPAILPAREEADAIRYAIELLGFRHFATFQVVGVPYHTVVMALMHQWDKAYGNVYHVVAQGKTTVWCDFVTQFGDGGGLTTTHRAEAVALRSPPRRRMQLLKGAAPNALWEAHRAMAAEIAPSAGGVVAPVGREHYVEAFCREWYETAQFQMERGVWVPG